VSLFGDLRAKSLENLGMELVLGGSRDNAGTQDVEFSRHRRDASVTWRIGRVSPSRATSVNQPIQYIAGIFPTLQGHIQRELSHSCNTTSSLPIKADLRAHGQIAVIDGDRIPEPFHQLHQLQNLL
jgi:hypothetical protein